MSIRAMLVSHRFPPDGVAGVERITQSLATELSALGCDVNVFTRRPGEPLAEPRLIRERMPDGTLVRRIDGGGEVRLNRPLARDGRLESYFTAALVESNPEVVHFVHLLGMSPRCVAIAKRYGAAVVMSLQDFYMACPLLLLRKINGGPCCGPDAGRECARTCFAGDGEAAVGRWSVRAAYFRRLLSLADRLIVPSQYMHDWFAAYGADPDRMQIVPNGVSIPRLAPDDLPADDAPPATRGVLRIAFLGSVVRHKGLHVVLDALKEMPADLRIELTAFGAAGDAGYVREVRSAAASLQHVALRLYGPYEPRQLPLLLDGFDCAVAPSTWPEAFAIVVREALVRGLPVLVSRRGGLPEAVRDGESGFTFDPDRPCELAHQLLRVASEPGVLSRLRRGALASHVLTTSERARRVLDIYRSTQAALSVDRSCRVTRDEVDALHDALVSMGLGD